MQPPPGTLITIFATLIFLPQLACAQSPEAGESGTVRVRVTMNSDGSRTVYQFDDARRKATSTTTGDDGKMRQRIDYDLDEFGRFSAASVFGPDNQLRFKSRYTYNSGGQLLEETQSAQDGAVLHKIVYSYDQNGRQTGYSVFDASGKLLGRTAARSTGPSPTPKSRAQHLR